MRPKGSPPRLHIHETLGFERPLHIAFGQYVKDDPKKFGVDVGLTVSGGSNIIRGGRMSLAGIKAIQKSQTMKRGISKSFAVWKGARQIVKGSRRSRRGTLMASVGGIELTLDPDIPFVPMF